ncbi:hypothetical protein OUZ56_029321 [Daphnia magna]|uniref:Uncharacterized protein n=1 Tax=Daphnia magna TaxID=35525 RepID=A0ABR0B6G7_9CRUS|nr:hypothetical protein OUZ56_029321 [Daphnia magna]
MWVKWRSIDGYSQSRLSCYEMAVANISDRKHAETTNCLTWRLIEGTTTAELLDSSSECSHVKDLRDLT